MVEAIRAEGAELVVVGNGRPDQAAQFKEEQGIDFPLLVDPDLTAYRAAGLKKGMGDVFRVRSIRHAVRALRKGFRQASVRGDPWQLGGTFVIGHGGKLIWSHVSREAGDHPEPEKLLAALRGTAHPLS